MRVQSVERAIAILREFSVEQPTLGVTELSERLGLHKSTVHRLLASLVVGGFMRRTPKRKYRLGTRLIELGYNVINTQGLLQVAHPYLHYLAERVGELAYLGVRDGDSRLNVMQSEPPELKESVGWVARAPLGCTSSGKILLAHMSEDEVAAYLEKGLPRMTAKSITDPTDLRRELQRVREEGFGTSFEEFREGTNAISVPIAKDSMVVAALAVVGYSYSLTQEKAMRSLEIMRGVAVDMSRKLGTLPSEELDLFK